MSGGRVSVMQRKALRVLVVGSVVVLAVLAFGAQSVLAQPEPNAGVAATNWETGNVCVRDYKPGADCTAEDVKIAGISPSIAEACTAVGDTATVNFTAQIQTNATERYDIGLFVALDGGSARDGDSCYHDFLQPASAAGPWDLYSGSGPFKELEVHAGTPVPDTCGDTLNADGPVYYRFQQAITVLCVDANGDGAVDPFSTCTSWDNSVGYNCFTVQDVYPSTTSKCKCTYVDPGLLIYSGYDWGDLPDVYHTLEASNGPRHAIQDPDNNWLPTTQGGVDAVWLGATVDHSPNAETNGIPTTGATGDDLNTVDDEDGVALTGTWLPGPAGAHFSVTVGSSGTCNGSCRVGYWIDWNNDGDFADQYESGVAGVTIGSNTLDVGMPAVISQTLYARFRLVDGKYTGTIPLTGVIVNGEVEDYRWSSPPTAVDMLPFSALAADSSVTLFWETASEIDNLGFNVYRATAINGPRVKLNSDLIPSLVAPGSPFGAAYEYTDTAVKAGKTYYYWLEDIDVFGKTGLSGPVDAKLNHQISKELPPAQPRN